MHKHPWMDWTERKMQQLAPTKDAVPTHIYVGLRARVIAEASARDFYPGKYLVQPLGSCDFIADGADTLKEAKACVRQWKRDVPGIKVVWL